MAFKRNLTLLIIGLGLTCLPLYPAQANQISTVTPNTAANQTLATHLVLKLKERKVYVYQDKQLLAQFTVAVGKKGWETPTGKFEVRELVRNPVWKSPWTGKVSAPGPNSPLGERWIGFWSDGKNSIGFHGTPAENSLCSAASHGCVRMRNRDVKVLFDLVRMGTPVIVQP